jgi:hypothetical protein
MGCGEVVGVERVEEGAEQASLYSKYKSTLLP